MKPNWKAPSPNVPPATSGGKHAASRSQYDVGLETLSDHLEAQAMWQQAYETHVDARFRLYLN